MSPPSPPQPEKGIARQVVYMPSCVTRMMGPASSDSQKASVHEKMLSVFDKAGYQVIYPEVRTTLAFSRFEIAGVFSFPGRGAPSRIGLFHGGHANFDDRWPVVTLAGWVCACESLLHVARCRDCRARAVV
jgi:hypothetical protein